MNGVNSLNKSISIGVTMLLLLGACDGSATSIPTSTRAGDTSTAVPSDTALPVSATPTLIAPASSATATSATATRAIAARETDIFDAAGFALRFFGSGNSDIDRVKIKIDAPQIPADIGATDFTLEWWMKANAADNPSDSVLCDQNDGWIYGNILFDRDIWGSGDYGDFGISLSAGHVAFGVNNGSTGTTVCSLSVVTDDTWHHVAVTRSANSGQLAIFIDGTLDAQSDGPAGDISYRDGRSTDFEADPFLVIGAEKHDAGAEYPSYNGWIDEVRLSTVVRYTSSFTRPHMPFAPDANTAALWHFDEGAGDIVNDEMNGISNGQVRVGGTNGGPLWVVSDAPLMSDAE